jgi:prepilin-type N-terminal cleavage/methylation domain-containing protein
MRKTIRGFTVVELLIVVAVIGVLVTISVVMFSSSQKRSQNVSKVAELKLWQKAFVQYKATNGSYPPGTDESGYCLGKNFPGNKCRDYNGGSLYTEAASQSLMTALSTYDPPQATPRVPVGGTVGPYAYYTSTNITLYAVLEGKTAAECPPGSAYSWTDGTKLLLCSITLTK